MLVAHRRDRNGKAIQAGELMAGVPHPVKRRLRSGAEVVVELQASNDLGPGQG